MVSKFFTAILKALSALVYVLSSLLILSVPVLFTVQAFIPPVFTLNSVKSTDITDVLSPLKSCERWYRADFYMTAGSGVLSPYFYDIDDFDLCENKYAGAVKQYYVVLDAPLHFTNRIKDDFIISLYIRSDAPEEKIQEFLNSVEFEAKNYRKGFASFTLTYKDKKFALPKK